MKYYIIVITIICLIIISIFYEKKMDIFNKERNIETLVKNISNNSKLSKNTTYNAGDILEYAVIVKPEDKKELNINTNKLINNIDIATIEINGKKLKKEELDNYNFLEDTLVKITGKAKTSNKNGKNQTDIIKVEEIKTPQNKTNTKQIEKTKTEKTEKLETTENKQENQNNKNNEIEKEIKNIKIEKINYYSNINNLIKISGDNLEEVEYVNIGKASFKPTYSEGYLYLLIEKNDYLSGEHFVLFQQKNGKLITYKEKINFILAKNNIFVTDITPKTLKNDIDRHIILQGKGFNKIISVQLSNNLVLKDTSFNIINDRVANLVIPKKLLAGKYNLNIMDTKGIYRVPIAIKITN